MKKIASLFLLLSLCQLAFADDEKDKDQHHHEDLTETQLGTVHFPVAAYRLNLAGFASGSSSHSVRSG